MRKTSEIKNYEESHCCFRYSNTVRLVFQFSFMKYEEKKKSAHVYFPHVKRMTTASQAVRKQCCLCSKTARLYAACFVLIAPR